MQKITDLLWSRITKSYEAQTHVWDKEANRWECRAEGHSSWMHFKEQRIHDLECEISELENRQLDPHGKEVQLRQKYNEERIRQLKIELYAAGLDRDGVQFDILECEAEARRSQKKALEIRDKALAIQKMPNPFLQIKQLYYETQACKCDEKALLFETRANELRRGILRAEAEVRASDYSASIECLTDPQPAPSWQKIGDFLRGHIFAGLESPSEWADRKRQCDNRDVIPGLVDELCECETQARHWREKENQFRNKASALTPEPTSDIELPERSERSALLDSGKRNNYQATEPSTI
jgi:hypothetical protein